MTSQRNFHGTSYHLSGDPGQKPLVVLVHGVGLNHAMWRVPVKLLAPDFALLTYDLLGHGDSCNPAGARAMRDYVDQLTHLVEHLGAARFALAGFSMGALIAQACASAHPRRLTHLALLHSVYRRTAVQRRGVRERYRAAREQGPAAVVEAAIERWFSPDYRRRHAAAVDQIRAIFRRHTGDGYLKAYRLFAHAEAEMARYPLDRVTCPALVLTGDADHGSTPAMARALCRALPNGRLIVNPEHRHMAPVEHAAVITGQLRKLLIAPGGYGA